MDERKGEALSAELVQLASVWDFRTIPSGGMMAETKIDGWRAAYLRNWRGEAGLYTRNGHEIHGVGHILHKLAMLERAAGEPMFFDGEFQVRVCLSATKHWCERGWKGGGEAGTFHLFDAMPLSQWKRGGSDTPLYRRKASLVEIMAAADAMPEAWEWREGPRGREPEEPAVVLLKDEWVANAFDALALARRAWAAKLEGLVLKYAESPYQRKRAPWWMKVKTPAYKAA
jgi:ATP-dependent DNA ligase